MSKAAKDRRPGVKVLVLAHGEGLPLPAYQSDEAAGLDLMAAVGEGEVVAIGPGKRALVPTGFSLALPKGFEAQVRPRSGLALKHGVTVLNSPGTIDSDYRGEVKIILVNLGDEPFAVRRGERIAQLVIAPVVQVQLKRSAALAATRRGAGGFGSTKVGQNPAGQAKASRPKVRKKRTKSVS